MTKGGAQGSVQVEVYDLQTYELIRRAVILGGKSFRQVAKEFGLNRRTVKKMAAHPVPPGYEARQDRRKPKLGAFLQAVEEIVEADKGAPKRQRHTAKRIFERLRDERGYKGSYQQVRVYVAKLRQRSKECFVPLVHAPGEAQADFFEAVFKLGGDKQKAHVFLLKLPCSSVWFARAYPSENAESFVDGHEGAFVFLGGVPKTIVYDNPMYAVRRDPTGLRGRVRRLMFLFDELRSAFLFEPVFCNVASGNEKGSVERQVQTLRRSAFVPLPEASGFQELNDKLLALARAHLETVKARFEEEAKTFLPLVDFKPRRLAKGRVDRLALVRFDRCSYSVPFELCYQEVLIRATPFTVEFLSARRVVAEHPRCAGIDRVVTRLEHYVGLLERKPRAAKSALPVIQAGLPDEFEAYRRNVEDGTGVGDRRFVAILRLACLHGVGTVTQALRIAGNRGITDPAAIGMMCLKRQELPAPKAPSLREGVAIPKVERQPLSEYGRLMAGAR